MDNINFNLLKYFYYVAYYKGFTNAAKQLRIVQSALSYNVKSLENLLGKVLIIRNKKKFELTDDGMELYETLKTVFSILEKTFIPLSQTNFFHELSIGIRYSLSDLIFKDFFSDFINNNPNIHLNINLYSKLDNRKFEEDYDIVIDYEENTTSMNNPNKKTLCELSNIIVCGKDLFNSYKEVKSIKELDNENFIALCPNKKKGKMNKFCFENDISFKDVVSINDSITCLNLIKENIGLCIINEESVKKELLNGSIKKINITEEIFKDKIVIIYKDNKKSNLINKFIEELFKSYGKEEK